MTVPAIRLQIDPALERLQAELQGLVAALPTLVLALVVVVLGWLLGRWLSRRALLDRIAHRNPFMRDLARTAVRWVVMLATLLVALEILDATALVGAVLGTAGVLGVALGFAFKDIVENYLAGLLMSLRQPFAPKDHVVIEGNEGIVVRMTSRATILMTPDGNHLRLPNALVFRSVTLNYTRNPSRRFEFDVGIGVGEDLVRAQAIGTGKMAALEGVVADPPPRAFITALGDSNVHVRYQGWVDQRHHDFAQVKSEAIRSVKLALEEAGMDMPEPIYRVQLREPARASDRPAAAPPATQTPVPGGEVAVDTRATREIEARIDLEASAAEDRNLLDPSAPRE